MGDIGHEALAGFVQHAELGGPHGPGDAEGWCFAEAAQRIRDEVGGYLVVDRPVGDQQGTGACLEERADEALVNRPGFAGGCLV